MINKDKRNAAAGDAWKAMQGNDPMAQELNPGRAKANTALQTFNTPEQKDLNDTAAQNREQDNANWQAVLGTPEQDEAAMPLHEMLAGLEF